MYRLLPSQCLHKERLLPTAEDLASAGEFGRCWPFLIPRPKVWILANQDGQVVKTVHIYCWQFRLLQVQLHTFSTVHCTSQIPAANAKLPWGAESDILPHLP